MRRLRAICAGLPVVLAGGAVLASEGGGGASLIEPQIGTMFWTTITFLILVVLLGRFAWKPLLGALEQREKSIAGTIEGARKDRESAEALLVEHRQLLDQARRERAEAVAAGQRDAERLKTEILDQARRERDQVLAQTEAQIQSAMREARGDLKAAAVDLAIAAAERLLSKNLDDAAQRRLVEEYVADLEARSGTRPS
jgi:F-type H+-transporting ATPase subunit b